MSRFTKTTAFFALGRRKYMHMVARSLSISNNETRPGFGGRHGEVDDVDVIWIHKSKRMCHVSEKTNPMAGSSPQ